MAEIKKLNSMDEYNYAIKNNEKVIIKFSADWCGPCRFMSSIIDSISDVESNGVMFYEINVDENWSDRLCQMYDVHSIPLMLFFRNGILEHNNVGVLQKSNIISLINKM